MYRVCVRTNCVYVCRRELQKKNFPIHSAYRLYHQVQQQ